MPRLPTVAIIGKPNTGKSTLFNRLVGGRKAIVSETPGTTRDHVAAQKEGKLVDYLLIDTGGMGGGTEDKDLEDDVHRQSILALENADLILFTIDSRTELTASDTEIVSTLRKRRKRHVPVLLVITKCDNLNDIDETLPQYYQLDIAEDVIAVSAPHKTGIEELQNAIEGQLCEMNFAKSPTPNSEPKIPNIAIVGKPNVGKSSVVNALMSEGQREQSPLLVSDIAGTTRDTTDTHVKYHDQEYIFMDTAGLMRRKQTTTDIELYASFRSMRAIELADIVVLVLDATEPVTRQDKRIASTAVEAGKGLILVLNKWDLVEADERTAVQEHMNSELAFCKFAPMLTCSAKTRDGLLKLFDLIETVNANRQRRIATKALHTWFEDAMYGQPLRQIVRTKHITQAKDVPPTFVLFVRNPKKIPVSQLRYLDNRIRKSFAFEGTPVRWITKQG